MAITYDTPKTVFPNDWSYETDSKYWEYWVDFKEKALQGEWANALNGKFNAKFEEATKDWTVDDYRNWAESSGLNASIKKGLPSDYSQWTNLLASNDIGGIQRVIGALVMDRYGHFTDEKYEASTSEIATVVDGMRSYNAQKELVSNLKDKGGTDAQIQAILDSRDGTTEDYTTLYDEIADLSGDDWNNYIDESLVSILPDNSWGDPVVITPENAEDNNYTYNDEDGTYTDEDGNIYEVNEDNQLINTDDGTPATTGGYTPSDSVVAAANAATNSELAANVIQTATFGDATDLTGLTPVEGTTDEFTDADGNTVVLTDTGEYRYENGDPYISPNQTTLATELEDDQADSDAAEEVASDSLENIYDSATTAQDLQTSVVGGDVSTGVAEQLGWQKGIREEDGTQVTTFTDPRTNETYDVDPTSGMLLDASGNPVSTVGSLNFEENDFAQQFTNAANDFLYGAAISEREAVARGFTKNDDGTYLGPDGKPYSVNDQGNLIDEDSNLARSDGFLDYQTQLENANAQYLAQIEGEDGLVDQYKEVYGDYETDLRPRLGRLDTLTDALTNVAADADDPNYYSKLQDLYYQDSVDEINRGARSQRSTLEETYANAGLDASSPAFTKALMDLETKRNDATRSARRQAILDSYGLGSAMLTNRTSALNSAQTGVQSGMNALSDLYDVRLQGLNVERDMVSELYSGQKEGARLGMEGLGVTAALDRDLVNANQDKYFKDLDVRRDLNLSTQDTNVTANTAAINTDTNANSDYWAGMGWLQTLVDNDFDWLAAGSAIKTQFPDFDTSSLNDKLQEKFGFK